MRPACRREGSRSTRWLGPPGERTVVSQLIFDIFRASLDVELKVATSWAARSDRANSARISCAAETAATWRCTMNKKMEFENQPCF
jgi:hypothetical protein